MSSVEQERNDERARPRRPAPNSQATRILYVDEEAERYASEDSELQQCPRDDRREALSVFSGCYVDLGTRDHISSQDQSWGLRTENSATAVGRQLAGLASQLERENAELFDQFIDMGESAYTNEAFFSTVAVRLFSDGPTYGKVVALLAFGYRYLKRNVFTAAQTIGLVIGSLVKALFNNRALAWLKESGGWASLVPKSYTGQVLCGVAAVVLVASFVYFKWYGRQG